MQRIADHGVAGFYEGPTAAAILECSRAHGGTMSADDLRDFEPEWVDPISTTYHGWSVYEIPPNTQGIAALIMLDLMEQFPLRNYGFATAASLHVMIEAMKRAYADRARYLGDPAFVNAPVNVLTTKEYAARQRATIDLARATPAAYHQEPSRRRGRGPQPQDTPYRCRCQRS